MEKNYNAKPLFALLAILIIPWFILIPLFIVVREIRIEYVIVGVIFLKIILLTIWGRVFKKKWP